MQNHSHAAFIVGPRSLRPGGTGPMAGVRFAVKDVFDVAGLTTGAGNPDWRRTHEPATDDAVAVARLAAAGGELVGTTVTDELAFSLSGSNVHDGTPPNPAAPDREPGGSSAGSVSAVAAGAVDVALGTDTGGPIRVPASYCGVLGLHTTHGLVPTAGVVPLAPSFDTVGVLAGEGAALAAAVAALATEPPSGVSVASPAWRPRRLLVATDLMAVADDDVAAAARTAATALGEQLGATVAEVDVTGGRLDEWFTGFRTFQSYAPWQCHGAWIERVDPAMGSGVRARFAAGSQITAEQVAATDAARTAAAARVRELVADDAWLVLPSAASPAVPLSASRADKEERRARTLRLCCGAGLAGTPALSLPTDRGADPPAGLCVVGDRGADLALADVAAGWRVSSR